MPRHPLPRYSPTPCPQTRAASMLSQAGTSKGLCRRQLWDDALPVTDASPCSGSLFLPSLSTLSPAVPASLPGCWHTPGPASAGSRASNWKGELQSTKAYQLAVREHSAATSGASQGLEGVGSLLSGSMGWTCTAAPLRAGTAEVRAGWWLVKPSPSAGLWRRAVLEQGTAMAQCSRSSHDSLRCSSLASGVPPSTISVHSSSSYFLIYPLLINQSC